VLYGGSVDSKNVNNFIGTKLMDGVLVGTSSLDHKEFIAINKAASS
jgi:triosephosphate isomerase